MIAPFLRELLLFLKATRYNEWSLHADHGRMIDRLMLALVSDFQTMSQDLQESKAELNKHDRVYERIQM